MFRGYKDKGGKTVMDKEYLVHAVFDSLAAAADFYARLSSSVMSFVPLWVKSSTIINYDSYFFEAIANSLISIKTVLELGHITDAKVLLRSLYDEIIINLYFMARLKRRDDDFKNLMNDDKILNQNLDLEGFFDVDLSDWLINNKTKSLKGTLRYDEMKKFLSQEVKLSGIVEYLDSDECKKIREWLNDAVHLNHYKSILLNNGLLCIDKQRKIALDNFRDAFDKTIMFHVTCVFCMNPMYLMSSDYSDYMACGMEPPVDCQYDVAPFIQAYLDKTIYQAFPDWIAKLVEVASPMRLRKFEGS